MPFKNDNLEDITIPEDAGVNDNRFFIGQNDPLLESRLYDAGIIAYSADQQAIALTVDGAPSPTYTYLAIRGLHGTGGLGGYTPTPGNTEQTFLVANFDSSDTTGALDMLFVGTDTLKALPSPHIIEASMRFRNGYIEVNGELHDDYSQDSKYLHGQQGSQLVSFTNQSSFSQAVVYPTPYPVGVVPIVMCNIDSGAGATARWTVRAINRSNTGFTAFCFTTQSDPSQASYTPIVGTWSNIPVTWVATLDANPS